MLMSQRMWAMGNAMPIGHIQSKVELATLANKIGTYIYVCHKNFHITRTVHVRM